MSSILQPIRINELYIPRSQEVEEIEKRISEYESVINPINQYLSNNSSSDESSPYLYDIVEDSSYELLTESDEPVINIECEGKYKSDREFNKAINDFLEMSYNLEHSEEDSIDCAICLEQIYDKLEEDDAHILYTECNHKIHLECMIKWRKHRDLSINITKMTQLKCELCQSQRNFRICSGLVEVKKSNRFYKMCCIV